MVREYPAAAALRRRAARMQANGQVFPPNVEAENQVPRQNLQIRQARRRAPPQQARDGQQRRRNPPKLSSLYCLLSLFLALLAIITSSSSSTNGLVDSPSKNSAMEESLSIETSRMKQQQSHSNEATDFIFKSFFASFSNTEEKKELPSHSSPRSVPPLLRWMLPPVKHEELQHDNNNPFVVFLQNMIDPALLHPQPSTLTDIIDKILTSTPRILCICNVLLAFTWLLHSMVANLFLGQGALQTAAAAATDNFANNATSRQHSWAGRERLGGFLVFKLLLISAVVAPDTLDLLILLSWYTLLSFLKSLASLCAATTAHTSASGQPPRPGVLRLLLVVLISNVLAAAFCVALFHGAGWGMVLLLTCDCALLFVDVLVHALSHVSQVLEDGHSTTVRELEERQVDIHTILNGNAGMVDSDEEESEQEDDVAIVNRMEELRQESRQLDRRMELLETFHAKRISILDGVIFAFQLLAYAITVAHFLHIWSLHGLQFTLIDGVLALHLHSALSSAGKRICERRNLSRIARDLDGLFDNASEVDMRKAGDVCCICLVTMTTGNVKRVGCGHLYHTHCLREVVERARSIEAAKCPLCRASVLDGRHHDDSGITEGARNVDTGNANAAAADGGQLPRDLAVQPPQPPAAAANANALPPALGEHALFRFSTENILPAWMPVPAFSFEVVRRPPIANADPPAADQQQQQDANRNNDPARPSFFRRLLIMAGAIPMSPEETAMYLDQLVDMFPQYDRADLLRELRMRGSSEAVVEAVLMGVFSGVPRGGGDLPQDQELPPPRRTNDAIQQDAAT
jgi:hypothetical protein